MRVNRCPVAAQNSMEAGSTEKEYRRSVPHCRLREANQVGGLQPTTLVSYDAEFVHIFDTQVDLALRAEGMNDASLADPIWRDQMKTVGEAQTQAFASRLTAAGYHGLLVRSFAPGATKDNANLVLWKWSNAALCRLTLIDDEGCLSR